MSEEDTGIPNIRAGLAFRLRGSINVQWNSVFSASYKAPKNQRFVVLFLGAEPRTDKYTLDPVEILKSWGWTPPSDIEASKKNR